MHFTLKFVSSLSNFFSISDYCFVIFFHFNTEKNNRAEVPDKYFVITNNEIVRLRYLIVYGSEIAKLDRSNSAQCNAHDNTVIDWIYRHKWLTAMIIYTAILLVIGASNSRHGYYMRQYMRQATLNAINYIKTIDFMGLNLFQKIFN